MHSINVLHTYSQLKYAIIITHKLHSKDDRKAEMNREA